MKRNPQMPEIKLKILLNDSSLATGIHAGGDQSTSLPRTELILKLNSFPSPNSQKSGPRQTSIVGYPRCGQDVVSLCKGRTEV